MRTWPPSESLAHSASTSSLALHRTWNETDGLNLKSGPALMAANGCPASSNQTRSQSPEGVSRSVVRRVIREPGIAEV